MLNFEQPKPLAAFDLETAEPSREGQGIPQDCLGITCAAAQADRDPKPMLWYAGKATGRPTRRMTQEEALNLLTDLAELAESHTIVTWNGIGFDFPLLGLESGDMDRARDLALNHIDMMFVIFMAKGWPIGLNTLAMGMGVRGKPTDTSGHHAPNLWAQGKFNQVTKYCANDARITLDLALSGEDEQELHWQSQNGNQQGLDLEYGWMTVREAMATQMPDNSWMDNPIPKEAFTGWLQKRQSWSLQP